MGVINLFLHKLEGFKNSHIHTYNLFDVVRVIYYDFHGDKSTSDVRSYVALLCLEHEFRYPLFMDIGGMLICIHAFVNAWLVFPHRAFATSVCDKSIVNNYKRLSSKFSQYVSCSLIRIE